MYRSKKDSAKYQYGAVFAWLAACTALFVILAPMVQAGTAAVVRTVFGIQKIVYAKPLSKQTACIEGVRAHIAIPYDASLNSASAIVFDSVAQAKSFSRGYAFLADGNSFVGTVERQNMLSVLDPVFASGKTTQAYTADKTLITVTGKGNNTLMAETPKQTVVAMGETISIAVGNHMRPLGIVVNIHDAPQSPIKQLVIRTSLATNALQAVCVVQA